VWTDGEFVSLLHTTEPRKQGLVDEQAVTVDTQLNAADAVVLARPKEPPLLHEEVDSVAIHDVSNHHAEPASIRIDDRPAPNAAGLTRPDSHLVPSHIQSVDANP
jgi:hypothetical protein